MHAQVVLTSSESKRLIAKGVAASPAVRKALASGTIAIFKGSTNSYVVEEITGRAIRRTDYLTGMTVPKRAELPVPLTSNLPDVVLANGKPVDGTSAAEAVGQMRPGDVAIKGANALNYERRQAAILVGPPGGGNIGALIGPATAMRVHVLMPVGLEKSVSADLSETARIVNDPEGTAGGPALWPINGEIFTEIEALEVLTGVQAFHISSGGIGGAEGAVRLLVSGEESAVKRALEIVRSILGEPPFVS
jgi:hypothetical protein